MDQEREDGEDAGRQQTRSVGCVRGVVIILLISQSFVVLSLSPSHASRVGQTRLFCSVLEYKMDIV